MLAICSAILLLAATAASQEAKDVDRPWFAVGANHKMISVDDRTRDLLEQARTHPNLTRSIKFNPFDWTIQSQSNPNISKIEWYWRVNVSEFTLPHARLPDKPDMAPHMITTTYDFSWPSGGNMSLQLNDTSAFCVRAEYAYDGMSRNVTNAFTEEDANDTDCSSALSQECIEAIISQEILVNGTCKHPSKTWARLPQCSDSFGFSLKDRDSGVILGGIGDLNGPRNGSSGMDWQYKSGEQILFHTTSIFDPDADDDGRIFRNESRALQVILLKTNAPSSLEQGAAKLLCMRVDTAEFEGSAGRPLLGFGALAVALLATALVLA